MKGKRTHLTVALALLYIVGGKLHLWPLDNHLLAALGFAAASFLRSALPAAETEPLPDARPGYIRAPISKI